MRELAEVSTLRSRRIQACDKFAKKCLGVPRFARWFPRRVSGRTGSRAKESFQEDYARCNRLRDSPIFYMRRRLNGKEGKQYGLRNKEYREEGGKVSEEMNPRRKMRRT